MLLADYRKKLVFLQDVSSKTDVQLMEFERGVTAEWAPDSRHFLINDGYASNQSTCWVYDAESPDSKVDIETLLRKENDLNGSYPYLKNDKVYIEGNWLNSKKVRIKISGWGELNPRGYGYSSFYVLGVGFEKGRMRPTCPTR